MAKLQELIQTQNEYIRQQQYYAANDLGLRKGEAYASYFPTWEVTAPQYITPTAYTLANLGYRTNEVAYACIDLWMNTISEPKMKVWDKKKEDFVEDHPIYDFLEEPCPDISETDFWKAVIMYLKIAGFMSWEKDRANDGSLLHVWPMMPQYCSFMRREKQLLGAVRYQPYTGLPPLDIPRDRMVIFSYVDPLYYGLKPFSPTMVVKDIIGLDNNMTTMIDQFTKNGAFLGGLLKSEQYINEADAAFAKERWKEVHGGPDNAGNIAVLGKGLEFQTTNNTFRDMVFPEVDARSEVRICMAYGVKPILISAKVGMDRSTMNNYKEGKSSWYEENVTSEWQSLEQRATRDILREFDTDLNHVCKFDLTPIKALQEDRNAQWERAREAYKSRIITRNDALVEMGKDKLTDKELGDEYFATAMEQTSLAISNDLDKPNAEEQPTKELDVTGQDKVKVKEEDIEEEEKHFRAFAKRRRKENKAADIAEFEFKFVDEKRQRQLKSEYGVPDPDAVLVIEALRETIKAMSIHQPAQSPHINITANIQPGEAPSVTIEPTTINIPEQKTLDLPAPIVNVNVDPTPIQNNVEVKTPRLKRQRQKVVRDQGLNLEGTLSEFEYEDDDK